MGILAKAAAELHVCWPREHGRDGGEHAMDDGNAVSKSSSTSVTSRHRLGSDRNAFSCEKMERGDDRIISDARILRSLEACRRCRSWAKESSVAGVTTDERSSWQLEMVRPSGRCDKCR